MARTETPPVPPFSFDIGIAPVRPIAGEKCKILRNITGPEAKKKKNGVTMRQEEG